MTDPPKFSYQMDLAAWLAFHEYHYAHSTTYRRTRLWYQLAVMPVAAVALIVYAAFSGEDILTVFVALSMIALLWFLLSPRLYDRFAMNQVKRLIREGSNVGLFGEYTVALTPDYLVTISPSSEAKLKWDRVEKVASTDDYLFIYMSSVTALVIPRASLSGVSFEEVKGAVNHYAEKASLNRVIPVRDANRTQ